MSNTCGDCKHYAENTCYSLAAAPSLLDVFSSTTPACEHFEPRQTLPVFPPQTRPENKKLPSPPADRLAMLSQETRDKLARQETERTRQTFLPLRYMPGAADR